MTITCANSYSCYTCVDYHLCRIGNKKKIFLTFEQQVNLLAQRGVVFSDQADKKNAEYILQNISYYGLVNGYKTFFILEKTCVEDEDDFNGSNFKDMISVYDFDRKLGSILLDYILKIEQSFGNILSYTIAEKIGYLMSEYCDKSKYNKGHLMSADGVPLIYEIDKTFGFLEEKKNSEYSKPIKHYRETQGNIPPWILIPELDFGKIVHLYSLCKANVKDVVAAKILDESRNPSIYELKELLRESLRICAEFRNAIAHGSRVINYIPEKTNPILLPKTPLLKYVNNLVYNQAQYDGGIGCSGILSLLISMTIIFSKRSTITRNFISDVSNHFSNFRNDHEELYLKIIKTTNIPEDLSDFLSQLLD